MASGSTATSDRPCFRDEDARRPLSRRVLSAGYGDGLCHPGGRLRRAGGCAASHLLPSTASIIRPPPHPLRAFCLQAMETYGSDKPDLRIDLTVVDATALLADCGFGPFEGSAVKAILVTDFTAPASRSTSSAPTWEVQSGNKAYWFRLTKRARSWAASPSSSRTKGGRDGGSGPGAQGLASSA